MIGGVDAFSIVAGSMLGIGIFLAPPVVAQNVHSPLAFFALWALGGLISLAGAVACAELGAMFPRAGGDYTIQHQAYGPSIAFATGWVLFSAIFCGSIATMSVALCTYQLPALLGMDLAGVAASLPGGFDVTWSQLGAIVLVAILTALNIAGAHPSARTQSLLTFLPVAVFALLALVLVSGFAATPAQLPVTPDDLRPFSAHGVVLAYMAVYFAYSGWINILYVAGEVEAPQTNIPRALVAGTVAITALYLLLCAGFVSGLGFVGLRDAGEAGSATAAMVAGPTGVALVTAMIASALVASINATILGGARVAYAMARQGAASGVFARVSEHGHVPHFALGLQGLLSAALILSGRFEDLYAMVSLTMVVTGSLTVGALFVLRKRRPELPRPYRATGYPLLPALYIVSSVVAVAVMVSRALSGEPRAWYPLIGLVAFVVLWCTHWIALRSTTPPATSEYSA